MNIYRTAFFATCPVNGHLIEYDLEIRTDAMIHAEKIEATVGELVSGFHESFADILHRAFGGSQTLKATHGRVDIETVRP